MKQKIHFWASLFTFSMIFFYSCQKTQDIIENKQISSLKMKSIIDSWKEEYIRGASNKN